MSDSQGSQGAPTASTGTALLELRNISKTFPGVRAIGMGSART